MRFWAAAQTRPGSLASPDPSWCVMGDSLMYVAKVSLKNIKGFKDLEFDLKRGKGQYAGWTVFTGENGSGKSTLLKAIAIALMGPEMSRAFVQNCSGWKRQGQTKDTGSEDTKGNRQNISLSLDIVQKKGDDEINRPPSDSNQIINISISTKSTGGYDVFFSKTEENFKLDHLIKQNNFAKSNIPEYTDPEITPEGTIWNPSLKGWFFCGYGPFRRIFGSSQDLSAHMRFPPIERCITLFDESYSLGEVDRWLKDLDYRRLENKGENSDELDLVIDVLKDKLLPEGTDVVRVDSNGLWLKDREGASLTWADMSDGHRTALALLTDILRHFIRAYGIEGLSEKNDEGKTVITRSGVVLIDEIDAHLHPSWQGKIGSWLKEHFPNVQFLVTSHSPLVCQAADKNGLFVLPSRDSDEKPRRLTPEEYTEVIASRSDTILLGPAFGLESTRSEDIIKKRARYARLRAKQRQDISLTSDEENELKEISQIIRPSEDDDVMNKEIALNMKKFQSA